MISTPFVFQPQPDWHWVSLSGPDAADFLQRLTTVDIRSLASGHGAPGFFLNAQGRIRSHFMLWRLEAESFGFEIEGGQSGHGLSDLLAVIDQFTFAERFQLQTEPLKATWILGTPIEGLNPNETRVLAPGVRACRHEDQLWGMAWTSLWAADGADLSSWIGAMARPPQSEVQPWLNQTRVRMMSPALDSEITSERNPLELGMSAGIAANKGCYPGQEVIEKIISLGAPSKRLALLEGKASPRALTEANSLKILGPEGSEVGRITSWAGRGDGTFSALGLISKTQAEPARPVRIELPDSTAPVEATIVKVAPYA